MPRDLLTLAPASRRMVLACYLHAHPDLAPAVRTAGWAALAVRGWVPTPADCPVPWARMQAWLDGVERVRVGRGVGTEEQ